MKQLSTLDTVFATFETARWPLHGGGVLVLDPRTAVGEFGFEEVVDHLRRALPDMPPLRRRLVRVPFGMSDPYWVEDPDFKIERHVRRIALPPPGGDAELRELVSQLGDSPLDFSKPLWEAWFIEGLAGGRAALYLKMHHACVDGMGGLAMLRALFSTRPDQRPEVSADTWVPDRMPTGPELVVRALPATLARPFRATAAAVGIARMVAPGVVDGLRRNASGKQDGAEPHESESTAMFSGPDVEFNEVTPGQIRRGMGWVGIPMADIARVREAHGGTLNDVALAICGGSMRAYLEAREQLPDRTLTAFNPVNMRTGEEDDSGEPRNQFSLLLTALHTEIADPVERLRTISAGMNRSKTRLRRTRRNPVEDLFTLFTPGAVSGLVGLIASPHAPEIKAPANVCVTNIAFTPEPLYFGGAKVEEFYVMMMQSLGLGLVVALISYAGTLFVSVTANRDALADPQLIADGCRREIDALLAAAR